MPAYGKTSNHVNSKWLLLLKTLKETKISKYQFPAESVMKGLFDTIISTPLLRPNICWEIMSHTQIVQAVL